MVDGESLDGLINCGCPLVMGHSSIINGISMGYEWDINGILVGYAWDMNGMLMGH